MTACCLGVRIELHHYSEILQWVLLENSALNSFATNDIIGLVRYPKLKTEANDLISIHMSSVNCVRETTGHTWGHEVLSGFPHSAGFFPNLCWSFCAWASFKK